jgi:hypothetical protein
MPLTKRSGRRQRLPYPAAACVRSGWWACHRCTGLWEGSGEKQQQQKQQRVCSSHGTPVAQLVKLRNSVCVHA